MITRSGMMLRTKEPTPLQDCFSNIQLHSSCYMLMFKYLRRLTPLRHNGRVVTADPRASVAELFVSYLTCVVLEVHYQTALVTILQLLGKRL